VRTSGTMDHSCGPDEEGTPGVGRDQPSVSRVVRDVQAQATVPSQVMAQLTVRIDEDLKGYLQALARREEKSTSDVVRSLVGRYVQDRDRGAALRSLWNRMQQNAKEAGAGPEDVEEAIQAVRGQGRDKEGRIEESRTDPAEDRP
jgi:predicted transcriptional regulator